MGKVKELYTNYIDTAADRHAAIEEEEMNIGAALQEHMDSLEEDEEAQQLNEYQAQKALRKALKTLQLHGVENVQKYKEITVKELLDPNFYTGIFTPRNGPQVFGALANAICAVKPVPEVPVRNRMIELLTEEYCKQMYEQPPTGPLYLLANFIMLETIMDNHPDKVSREEYPVLTHTQLQVRRQRELNVESITKTADAKTVQNYNIAKKRYTDSKIREEKD